jgi:tetratricopeptide (TPR) repeat protein
MMRSLALLIVALGLGSAAHGVGAKAGAARVGGNYDEELMYLPEGRILRMASLGHRNFAADLVWLKAIQYYGEQRLTTRTYAQAERLFQAIYDLDPHFKGATRFGALVLAQDAGNPEGALGLLGRARREHPTEWEYPFDEGFVCQTVAKDYARAGEAYRVASELPGAPDLAIRLAGISFAKLGDRQAAREVWNELLAESDNEMLEEIAVRNLRNLDMEDAQDLLSESVAKFREERGRVPADWNELIAAGYLAKMPADPFGGGYFLDAASGRVWSTTHVDRRMAQERDIFAGLLRELQQVDGKWPAGFDAVVDRGLARFPPWEPFGLSLQYDPSTGAVAWNPPWPEVEPGKHGEAKL